MFYDNYVALCKERGLSPSSLAVMLGFSKGTFGQWKKGSIPTNPTLKTIADYFDITVAELMSGETKTAPTKTVEADDEMIEMLEEIRRNPELKMLFSLSKKATPEDVRKTIAIMKTLKGDFDEGSNY